MKTKHIRSFEIENITFSLNTQDGYTCLNSLHPYDVQEYHWAIQDTDGGWQVFKGPHYRTRFNPMTPEEVAAKLLAFDRAYYDLMNRLGAR